MKRKIISALLALILCLSFAVSVSAEERKINFVYDQMGYLIQEESTYLSDYAWEIYENTGVGVFFSYLTADSLADCDTRFFAKGITNYVIMMENEAHWYIHLGGECEAIDLDMEAAFRAAYDEPATYVEGIRAYMEAVAQYFGEAPAASDAAAETPATDIREYKAIDYVVDDIGYLADSELNLANELGVRLCNEYGVGIFFVYTTEEDLASYDAAQLVCGMEDYYVMVENSTGWYSFRSGRGEAIDAAVEEQLRGAYDAAATYIQGVTDFLNAAAACFADTSEADIPEAEGYFVYDDADLLSDSEEAMLTATLQDISSGYQAQIAVCTIASLDGGNVNNYVGALYDTMGFGYGPGKDGVLLLVCMNPREYRILSNGMASEAITTDAIDAISEKIVSDLSDGDYAEAFDIFADRCEYYLDGHLNGFPFNFGKNLVIALAVGIALGLIVAFVLKAQLKSVYKQNQANVYVKPGSMNITVSSDIYLYRNVTRTKKQSSSSSSRSGSSRNIGGGSF